MTSQFIEHDFLILAQKFDTEIRCMSYFYVDLYYCCMPVLHLIYKGYICTTCTKTSGDWKANLRRELARVAEWLAHRTHNPMIAGSSLTGASNILGQDMNLVNTPQCCPSRGQQCLAPEVYLYICVHYIHLHTANKAEPTLTLKPRGHVTRNPKQGCQWPQNRTCECVWQKIFFLKVCIENIRTLL